MPNESILEIQANNASIAETSDRQQMESIEELLERTDSIEIKLDREIKERFGEDFTSTLHQKMRGWEQTLTQRGSGALDWIERKGIQLPQSKAGLRILSGTIGTAGMVIPGLGVLLPLSYILWKRSGLIKTPTLLEKQYAQ